MRKIVEKQHNWIGIRFWTPSPLGLLIGSDFIQLQFISSSSWPHSQCRWDNLRMLRGNSQFLAFGSASVCRKKFDQNRARRSLATSQQLDLTGRPIQYNKAVSRLSSRIWFNLDERVPPKPGLDWFFAKQRIRHDWIGLVMSGPSTDRPTHRSTRPDQINASDLIGLRELFCWSRLQNAWILLKDNLYGPEVETLRQPRKNKLQASWNYPKIQARERVECDSSYCSLTDWIKHESIRK